MAPNHVQSFDDLITPRENTVEGFLRQAVRKTEEATPYVKDALRLQKRLRDVHSADDLRELARKDEKVRDALLSAAGLSGKAQGYLSEEELEAGLARAFERAGEASNLRTSVFARYLLTQGDSLGGRMRNIVGNLGEDRFTDLILERLRQRECEPDLSYSSGRAERINRIRWDRRILFFNITPSFIGKNIDLILADHSSHDDPEEARKDPSAFLACGELKGGIDPAGADEHWKTARSALGRIRQAFGKKEASCPPLFFVGAAIEPSVAREVLRQLQDERLSHAANLTIEEQVEDVARWLLSL